MKTLQSISILLVLVVMVVSAGCGPKAPKDIGQPSKEVLTKCIMDAVKTEGKRRLNSVNGMRRALDSSASEIQFNFSPPNISKTEVSSQFERTTQGVKRQTKRVAVSANVPALAGDSLELYYFTLDGELFYYINDYGKPDCEIASGDLVMHDSTGKVLN